MQSMTGFGKGESENENFLVSVEIKSVNHRFKDIRFKMSSLFSPIEIKLRKKIEQNFKRGSFEIFISYKQIEKEEAFGDLDYEKIEQFIASMKVISEKQNVPLQIVPAHFLRNEFYVEKSNEKEAELTECAHKAFDAAIVNLSESRKAEGEKLSVTVKSHKDFYVEHLKVIEERREGFKAGVVEKLQKKFDEFSESIDVENSRVMQEIIFYMEKIDIDEEINRINIHLNKLDSLITDLNKEEVGRQTDFLLQEINRETNTIGSKSSDKDVSEAVVQMKVQLEKLREQALNLQ